MRDVWERYRQGKLHELPSGDLLHPLEPAWREWLAHKEVAARTRRDYAEAWERLGAERVTP